MQEKESFICFTKSNFSIRTYRTSVSQHLNVRSLRMCCKESESSAGSVSNSASMSRQSSWVELFSDVAALELSLTLQVTPSLILIPQ